MCVGCRERRAPDKLIRLAIGADGRLTTGPHVPGRGAWVCAAASACFDRAVAKGALSHALRTTVSSDDAQRVRSAVFVAERPDVRDYGVAPVYRRGRAAPRSIDDPVMTKG